jgi:transposase-like protein
MYTPPSEPAETTVPPKACPFCTSLNVTTTSKAVNTSTYWRCTACGQIWNQDRLQHARRPASSRYY